VRGVCHEVAAHRVRSLGLRDIGEHQQDRAGRLERQGGPADPPGGRSDLDPGDALVTSPRELDGLAQPERQQRAARRRQAREVLLRRRVRESDGAARVEQHNALLHRPEHGVTGGQLLLADRVSLVDPRELGARGPGLDPGPGCRAAPERCDDDRDHGEGGEPDVTGVHAP
jgi:hypothetical protein